MAGRGKRRAMNRDMENTRIAAFQGAGRSTFVVDAVHLEDGTTEFVVRTSLCGVGWVFECYPTERGAEAIRHAAKLAAEDLIGDMLCEGLIGYVCERCECAFEHMETLQTHIRDRECHDLTQDQVEDDAYRAAVERVEQAESREDRAALRARNEE